MDTNVALPVCSTETDWSLVVHLTTLSGEQRVPCLEGIIIILPFIVCAVQTNLQLCYVYYKMFFLSVASHKSNVCTTQRDSTANPFVDVFPSCNSFITR